MRSSLVILVALAACGGHAGATQPCFPAPGVSERLDVDLGVVGPMPMRDRDASSEPHVSPRVAACGD